MTRRCFPSKPTPTRGYLASGKILQKKNVNGERKTGSRLQKTPANGGINRRENYHFPRINEGNGTEGDRKGKTGTIDKLVRGRSIKEQAPSSGQGCKTNRSTLKPSGLASAKGKCWKIAVGQGLKVPSPDLLVYTTY